MEKQYERSKVVTAGIMNIIVFWKWRRIFCKEGWTWRWRLRVPTKLQQISTKICGNTLKRVKIFMEKQLLQLSYNKPNYFPATNYVNRKQYKKLTNTHNILYSRPSWRVTTWNEHVFVLINNQLDAQFLLYIFIAILYMFRATLWASSGQSIVSIQHLVYVILCSDRPVRRAGRN